ncbi:hypothetical protein Cgig2_020541 [Carnegiea gigantea]|uniref:Uncharacterized protein n=1 Tax=Carnegiea gigantea TaxID=171969 RepID=A0A9Q1JR39_9CARY|nr:hypothetical protein Cgig2_020541 [Carnegiea gigantea]
MVGKVKLDSQGTLINVIHYSLRSYASIQTEIKILLADSSHEFTWSLETLSVTWLVVERWEPEKQCLVLSRDRCVNTTVINSGPQLDQHLREFLCTIFECTETKTDNHPTPKCGTSTSIIIERASTLKLCFKNTCLIIQLLHIKSASALISVSKFLQLIELSFVGVGSKHSLNALERDYEITCRNAMDLGELGAALLDMDAPPVSLSKFLQLHEISFVGLGMGYCMEALERD